MDFEHALIVALLLCLVSHGSADPGPGNTCQMKCKECQKMGSLRKIGSCVSECVQSGNPEGFDCIDECNGEGGGNACDEVSTNCRNTVEGYECDCKNGYSDLVSDKLCAPNECSGEGGGNACDEVSTDCRNTVEGYACDCKHWYSVRVSDTLCTRYTRRHTLYTVCLDECIGEGGGNKCDKTTNCVDNEKGFTCECKKEFPERVDDVSCEAAKVCKKGPLGMESGVIPDASIRASPHAVPDANWGLGRLNGKAMYLDNEDPLFVEADIGYLTDVYGLITQGFDAAWTPPDWTAQLKVSTFLQSDSSDTEVFIKDGLGNPMIFDANTSAEDTVEITFPESVQARVVRIYPTKKGAEFWEIRFEVLGCAYA